MNAQQREGLRGWLKEFVYRARSAESCIDRPMITGKELSKLTALARHSIELASLISFQHGIHAGDVEQYRAWNETASEILEETNGQ